MNSLLLPEVQIVLPRLHDLADARDESIFPGDVASYLDFVRDPANGFVTATLPLGDGIEYSVKL